MKQLSLLDKGFLFAESRESPMHVGGVNLYTLPEGADEQEFLTELANIFRDVDQLQHPFGDRLKTGPLGIAGNAWWQADKTMDLDYHIRHSALPKPGRYRELFNLVSRLHATLLDRNRPLWEMHLIEGLQNRQFALYTKAHHAAVDGERATHFSRSMLSPDPTYRLPDSPLSEAAGQRYKDKLQAQFGIHLDPQEERNLAEYLKYYFDTSTNMLGALRKVSRSVGVQANALNLPFLRVPKSSLNTSIDGARRFVAQSWSFMRIRKIGKAMDGSFNDAVLAMCSGALRTYLLNHSQLPSTSLKAMVPMSLRAAGDIESSNAVACISADLATNERDPVKRFETIQASMRAGKELYSEMSASETELFSLILQTPSAILTPLGMADKLPAYNTVISNVPGMMETQYLNGARMDGSYPVSIVMDGVAINITLVTYTTNVDVGIIACRRSIPHVQRIIDYMEASLVELESALGIQ